MSEDFPERTTSHAKNVDLAHEKTPLDRAPDLGEAFDDAKAAAENSSEPQKPESERSTSHAKTIDLGHGKTALDRVPELDRAFENAKTRMEMEKENPGSGSGMVRRDAPSHDLTPPTVIRAEPDDENKKLAAAKAALKEYRDRMAQRGHDMDHQRDHGHER